MRDVGGTVPLDSMLRCHLCGYSLRGLDAESGCPECGTAVHTAIDALSKEGRDEFVYRLVRAAYVTACVAIPAILWGIQPQSGTTNRGTVQWMFYYRASAILGCV